jgi:membrane fusion protein (multidrug efflux system)
MFARVNAVFGSRPSALVIPEEAIVPQGGRTFVVKVVPGEKPDTLVSQRVPVKAGLRQPGKVEILEGLELDDTVVIAGHQRLQKDGTPVRVVDMSKPGGGKPAVAPAGGASTPPAASGAAPVAPPAVPVAAVAKSAPAAKPLSGPNPCLRGADATR